MKKFKFVGFLFLMITLIGVLCYCSSNNDLHESTNGNEEHTHEWNDGEIINKPNCTEAGLIAFNCKTCGETKLDVVSATGHDYQYEITNPTCTEKGYTTYTCEICNHSYIDSYVDALGHNEVVDNAIEATCTATGLTEGSHCCVCQEVLTVQAIIPMSEHNYIDNYCFGCNSNYYTEGLRFVDHQKTNELAVDGYIGTDSNVIIPAIYQGKPVTCIKNNAFNGGFIESITIPESVQVIEKNAFSISNSLSKIVVDTKNKHFDSRNNCNAIIDTTSNSLILGCVNSIIPEGITTIGVNAFRGCQTLKTIKLPDSLTTIENEAFSNCISLTSIVIPDGVTSIGGYAFVNCSNLKSVIIPKKVSHIGFIAFGVTTGYNGIKIYCNVSSKPSGWDGYWCYNIGKIYWSGEWEYDLNGNPVPLS